MKKSKNSVSIINGADGPTSFFIAKKPKKLKLSERIKRACYQRKRKRIEKKIIANPHTLDEVVIYIKERYGAKELSKQSYSYLEQYRSLKASLMIQHRPELLGDLAEIRKPRRYNEKTLKRFWNKMEQRMKKAESISDKDFPMNFHIYKIKISKIGEMQICIDRIWNILSYSYSGAQKEMKQLKRISKEIHCYYGVTKEDIENRSARYSSLVTTLST